MSKRVLIIQRRMTEYRVPLFERMRRILVGEGVKLQVIYGTPNVSEVLKHDEGLLTWGIEIPCRYLNIGDIQVVWQLVPHALVAKQDLIIVPQENQLLLNYWLSLTRRFTNSRLAFWGHGANFQTDKQYSHREKLKSWTAQQVDWWFAYTALSAEKVIRSGFPENRITCLNNAVDVSQLIKWRESISVAESSSLRARLDLDGGKVGIFLGSLHTHKRLGFLFAAVDEIRSRLGKFEFVIVGDGPLRDMVLDYVKKRPFVRWVGAKHGREKVLHLSIGQIMLNPGLVGLGILDSFALGLPMITTDCGLHSPEISYLDSGRNGLMVEDNLEAFASGAVDILKNSAVQTSMANACKEDSTIYSIDSMVNNFCDGILKACNVERI